MLGTSCYSSINCGLDLVKIYLGATFAKSLRFLSFIYVTLFEWFNVVQVLLQHFGTSIDTAPNIFRYFDILLSINLLW